MRRRYIILTVLLCGALSTNVLGQQKIDPTVEVNREFEGSSVEVNKSRISTAINDTLKYFNLDFDYSIFEKPYRDMYIFNPLPSVEMQGNSQITNQKFYTKLGVGTPFRTLGELYYQPNIGKRDANNRHSLVFNGSIDMFMGKLPLSGLENFTGEFVESDIKSAAYRQNMGINARYGYMWGGGEMYAKIGFNNNANTLYGANSSFITDPAIFDKIDDSGFMKDNYYRNYNTYYIDLGLRSYNEDSKSSKLTYNFAAKYQNTSDKLYLTELPSINQFNEDLISVKGEIGPTFGKYNQVLLGIESNTAFYSGDNSYHSGVFNITPMYKYENKKLTAKVGLNISLAYSNSEININKYHNTFSPYADLLYLLYKENLWAFVNIDGDNHLNTYSSLLKQNRWMIPGDPIRNSTNPFKIKGGIKGLFSGRFSYNLYAGYSINEGMIQFATSSSGRYLTAANSSNTQVFVGGELEYNSKFFNSGLILNYNSYSNGENSSYISDGLKPAGYPPFETIFYAKYNWRERIYIGADIYYRSSTPQIITDADIDYQPSTSGFTNIGLDIKYQINKTFGAYIEVDNLLNQTIQYHPFYNEPGINFLAGITISL